MRTLENKLTPAPLHVGTSGYAYKEWKGNFYPEKFPDKEMLRFYSGQFTTVEINHSFYQMPREHVLQQWAEQVPAGFQFALKANQKITHVLKLKNCAEILKRFRPQSFDEIYQAILLAIPLVGIPDVLDAYLVARKRLG